MFLSTKFEKLDLMVSAMERFRVLLKSGRNNVRIPPEELIVKIIVRLNSVDQRNFMMSSESVTGKRSVKRRLEDEARPDNASFMGAGLKGAFCGRHGFRYVYRHELEARGRHVYRHEFQARGSLKPRWAGVTSHAP